MKKILIFGDSHTGPLKRAADAIEQEKLNIKLTIVPLGKAKFLLKPFHKTEKNSIKINPVIRGANQLTINLADYDHYVFSGPLQSMRFINRSPWSYHAIFSINKDLDKTIRVSKQVLEKSIIESNKYSKEFINDVNSLGVKLYILEPHKIFNHHPQIIKGGWIKENAINMDSLYRETLIKSFHNDDTKLITLDESTYDKEGIMLDKYRSEKEEDYLHGNIAFASKMLKKLINEFN